MSLPVVFVIAYFVVGGFAGLLAGMFGVGGGIIIVPALTFLFTAQHLPPEYILHISLGTSLASIMFTSLSSVRAHHAKGAVIWPVVRRISPGIVAGTLAGAWMASRLSAGFLRVFFVVFLYYISLQMFFSIKPKPSRELPGRRGIFTAGSVIGVVSSFVGIGGGSMSVPFLVWCNTSIHQAIGTSAAIGFPIAVAGTVGYLFNGLSIFQLPAGSAGYIYLPALAGISVASILTAPFGARLAHKLPVGRLKKAFALLLIVTGTKMLAGLF